MTIAEMMQLPVLAGREDAAQKLFAYNDLVMEMSGKINLTGIKDPEESLIKNVKCLHIRAEEGGRRRKTRESFDIVTARAVKMLPVISEWALPFVKVGGVFAAMKGPGALDELKESGKILRELNAEVEEVKNLELPTGEKRCILYIRKTAPCPKTYPRKIGIAEKKPILGE